MQIMLITLLIFGSFANAEESDVAMGELLKAITERGQNDTLKGVVQQFANQKNTPHKANIGCPVPGTFFPTNRTEPACKSTADCKFDELCCDWFTEKHCLVGLDKTPRRGQCPAITMVNDACVADYPGCQYDSECTGEDERCCMNTLCEYKECLSTRQNIDCPVPNRSQLFRWNRRRCAKDINCGDDEKCCEVFGNKLCLKGISTIPKPGLCPSRLPKSFETCRKGFAGCVHDSACPGIQEKCCLNQKCSYHQCIDMNVEFSCPKLNIASTKSQVQSSSKKMCQTNADCNGYSSLCCNINGTRQCTDGIYNIPKDGTCPADVKCASNGKPECEYDSQCADDGKCCKTNCGYSKCISPKKAASKVNKRRELISYLSELMEE